MKTFTVLSLALVAVSAMCSEVDAAVRRAAVVVQPAPVRRAAVVAVPGAQTVVVNRQFGFFPFSASSTTIVSRPAAFVAPQAIVVSRPAAFVGGYGNTAAFVGGHNRVAAFVGGYGHTAAFNVGYRQAFVQQLAVPYTAAVVAAPYVAPAPIVVQQYVAPAPIVVAPYVAPLVVPSYTQQLNVVDPCHGQLQSQALTFQNQQLSQQIQQLQLQVQQLKAVPK